MIGTTLDPRERFLRAIADHIAPPRIAQLFLFPPLRRDGRETAVAVVAAHPEHAEYREPVQHADGGTTVLLPRHDPGDGRPDSDRAAAATCVAAARAPRRLVIYRAIYRWTRKGPDRGRWEVDVTVEADAPLHAVEDVVRGVHDRAGGGAEPERLTGEAVRDALGAGAA